MIYIFQKSIFFQMVDMNLAHEVGFNVRLILVSMKFRIRILDASNPLRCACDKNREIPGRAAHLSALSFPTAGSRHPAVSEFLTLPFVRSNPYLATRFLRHRFFLAQRYNDSHVRASYQHIRVST